MQPYRQLHCEQQSVIADKVLHFLRTQTGLLENIPPNIDLWHKIKTVDLVRNVPELVSWCHSLGLKIRETSVTIINQHQDAVLHIDELPVVAKINFPILNTQNTYNRWYQIPEHIAVQYPPITNQFGSEYYLFNNIDLNQCKLLGEVELLEPVVFNSQIAHMIGIGQDAQLPRVVLSITFFKEPVDLLG